MTEERERGRRRTAKKLPEVPMAACPPHSLRRRDYCLVFPFLYLARKERLFWTRRSEGNLHCLSRDLNEGHHSARVYQQEACQRGIVLSKERARLLQNQRTRYISSLTRKRLEIAGRAGEKT